MEEIIVRVARAIACLTRLRVLSCLAKALEKTPTQLSRELGIPINVVSTHLRILTSNGLIERRRSGPWCFCSANSPYRDEAISGAVTSWLRRLLASPAVSSPGGLPDEPNPSPPAEAEERLHALIFEAATAFTNVRRVQLLKLLSQREEADVGTLVKELRMSEHAVSRHARKLIRRGYVQSRPQGGRLLYRLARKPKSAIHAKLLAIVRAQWQPR